MVFPNSSYVCKAMFNVLENDKLEKTLCILKCKFRFEWIK
jgi:hypothetical protein